jgi:hypothetical protein
MEGIPASRARTALIYILSSLLITHLAACTLEISQTSATEAVTATAPTVIPATITATFDHATVTPAVTITQTTLPSAEGGLLVVNTKQGLWTARPDGTDGALRITGPLIIPGPLEGAISSVDGNFAYLTTSDPTRPYGNYPNLTLNIISLFGRGPAVTIPLTSPETEPATEFPSDILRAMVERRSFAWSPEGTRLAYIGAASGPSADLYEYLRESNTFLHLTDGPDQAYAPQWSPDGQWIVHTAAAGFGTGAGISVTGMYAARADGSGVNSLYPISEHSGGEQVIGWLDDHTAVSRSWFITCGPSDLRLTDLSAQKTDLVFDGCLSAAAVGQYSVLFGQSPDTAMFDKNPRPGMYILTAADPTPRILTDQDIREAVWMPAAGAFLARTQDSHLVKISPSGEIQVFRSLASSLPAVSPNGLYWASSADGLLVGNYAMDLMRVFDGEIISGQMIFSPKGDAIYFIDTAGNLYRADAPDWAPILLASNLQPAGAELAMAWVEEQ